MKGFRLAQRAPARDTSAPRDAQAVVFQAASLLLDYPGGEAGKDAHLIAAALHELPRGSAPACLDEFLGWWLPLSPLERETHYVDIFDLREAISLYLTDARPGDSRQRGAALVALRQAYRARGADVTASELPDYLPLMLEVAANVPGAAALLAAERQSLERLRQSLKETGSPFRLVVEAVLAALPAGESRVGAAEAAPREGRSPPADGAPRDGSTP
jgi:nitrate reductase delta subunit